MDRCRGWHSRSRHLHPGATCRRHSHIRSASQPPEMPEPDRTVPTVRVADVWLLVPDGTPGMDAPEGNASPQVLAVGACTVRRGSGQEVKPVAHYLRLRPIGEIGIRHLGDVREQGVGDQVARSGTGPRKGQDVVVERNARLG